MELLVQKPQFDAATLKAGKAVHVKDVTHLLGGYNSLDFKTGLRDIDTDAIVVMVSPLEIEVYYFNAFTSIEHCVKIPVDLVADSKLEIKLMEVDLCKTI